MGLLKKLTKPLSKVLDKIIPNEAKPFLPYLAAMAPFMMGPTGIMGSSMWRRALMSGALNIGSQLSQEGSEGEFSGISALLAAGTGAMTSPDAPGFFQGMQKGPTGVDKFGAIEVPYSDTGMMASVSDVVGKGGETASKFLIEQGKVLRPDETPMTMKNVLQAGALPISHGTADLAMADARRALRDYENEMAADEATSLIDDDGRRRAIRAAMEAAGHLEDTILDALGSLGLKEGGIVGMKHGGQLVKRGPGRPGYGGPHETEAAGRSYAAATSPGGGGGDAWQRQALKDFAKLSSTTTGGTRGTIDQNQLRKNIDLPGIKQNVIDQYMNRMKMGRVPTRYNYLNNLGDEGDDTMTRFSFNDLGIPPQDTDTGTRLAGLNKEQRDIIKRQHDYNIRADDTTRDFFYWNNPKPEGLMKNITELNPKSEKFWTGDVDPEKIVFGDKTTFAQPKEVYDYINTLAPVKGEGIDYGSKMKHLLNKAEGGIAGVLPKGKEVDYRGGGVIPIGSRERADDVPARLSKNEFVMTADAVRAAGGGNINQGAKRMYNLMNNLEARV
jgi:hypothetical protein